MKQRIKDSYKKLRATNVLSNFLNLSSIQISNTLLLLITIRIIAGNVGIEGFGMIMFAYRFSLLAGTVVNYGTGQSGVKDTVFNLTDTPKLSIVFSNTLWIRLLIFILFLPGLLGFYWTYAASHTYILLAAPIVLAEVFNPLCFFIGIERIRIFNIWNLASNVVAVTAIMLFIKTPADAAWVNFILGTANVITYFGLLIYLINRFKLHFQIPLKADLLKIVKDNFYLTINNISANLQQSIILFALEWGNYPTLLGAYALCDRFIGQCRNLLNIITNAVYPNAVNLYKQSADTWAAYRKKSKRLFAGVFFAGAVVIFILADFIIFILSKKHNAGAVTILRIMAFVPVVSALNVFSVLDMLLKNRNVYLFKIAMLLVAAGALVAFAAVRVGNNLLVGAFTLIMECLALVMYEYVIKKPLVHNG
ncbi:oligosaccharide flippase family protein [Mucilaginibacter sp. UR6-11]|uniref:oligosaccharide flippase family protein n=1 Tax=Mucilaginibacter sp. UR6-11 TaxID=1435644 RepID=UPI001E52D627|nr:oligosaccharide flippase family protein [Mucilaginibacter sp. UR6-11]MCC8423956.1 oligosaccharide flippase family protein [Mucilaginibacter sp. UR6-11]